MSIVHGMEHVIALMFGNFGKIPIVKKLVLQVKRLYRVFGSRLNYKPHVFPIQESKLLNKGREKIYIHI